jgi:hypothetical protein
MDLTIKEQKQILLNDIWFDINITFWNEDNDDIKEVTIVTQYPSNDDIWDTLKHKDLISYLKDYGGEFDEYEVKRN